MPATVHVTVSEEGAELDLQLAHSQTDKSATVQSSAASTIVKDASNADVGAAARHDVWSVTVWGGNVWAAFGQNPVAGSGKGHVILDGQTRDFYATKAGEKIAIKDV